MSHGPAALPNLVVANPHPATRRRPHPEVARRMAVVVPAARLLYLVREPVERAVSQYRHHRAEGNEARPMEEALPDPNSQYIARSRYHERLAPFLEHYDPAAITVVSQEEREDADRFREFTGRDFPGWPL